MEEGIEKVSGPRQKEDPTTARSLDGKGSAICVSRRNAKKRSRGGHAALERKKDQIGTAANAEFAEEIGDVEFNGALGNVEFARDFLVGEILEKRVEYFLLAAAEIGDGIGFETAALTSKDGIDKAGKDGARNPESAVGDEGQSADQLIARFGVS